MSADMFHLGWFFSKGFGPKAWKHPWAGSQVARFTKPDMGVYLAQAMERAGFDYIMIEDSSNVPYTYQGSHDAYLRHAVDTPKLDPTVLAPFLAAATKNLGVIVTCSTTEYHPFMLARKFNALDHTTDGRIGWNVVTSFNDGSAQNYGKDHQPEHDERYNMADEFMEVCQGLWTGWDDDALVLDLEKGIFADGSKVHPIDHHGKYYKVRGPLSAPPSPQRTPVICQAGGSERGRQYAAQWAETIICGARGVEEMKAFRADIRNRAEDMGRDPNTIKVLFLMSPIVDETTDAAQVRRQIRWDTAEREVDFGLAGLSRGTGVDFSRFDLDEPLPLIETNGGQSSVKHIAGKKLRDVLRFQRSLEAVPLTGTPDSVAAELDELMQEVGGDGFLMMDSYFSKRYVTEICDGLVPELQKRGLTRKKYEHQLFRDNLMAF